MVYVRRGEMEIIADLLSVADRHPEKGITSVMAWAGLNADQMNQYLRKLDGLVTVEVHKTSGMKIRKTLIVTQKGRDFLTKLNDVRRVLEPNLRTGGTP